MPVITLPDGSRREFAHPVTVEQVATSIGPGLAKAALAGKVDGKVVDTSFEIENDATVAVVTDKDPEGLDTIRHSTAHLLAHAVKTLFPEAQVTIGPVIEDGFYYDFSFSRPFTPEDLAQIEEKMKDLARADYKVTRQVMSRDDAVKFFKDQGEYYKAEIIASIPANEAISLYGQDNWVDLCRGPHVPSTGKLKAFKLMKVAGAYWRGDSRNEMLQRIYGTAWPDEKSLKAYLTRLEEAEKRDHRRIGKALDLFHLQEEAPGMVFWHERGWRLYQTVQHYMSELWRLNGYKEIRTPQLVDRSLWEKSGHWDKFHADMFITESEKRLFAVKPMNCPCHIQVYNQGVKSYRDLPLRLAEFGSCHRNEASGALHGLMRVRGFVQDDAHIFCTEEQIQPEVSTFIDLLHKVYDDFGFKELTYKLATRPPNRIGSDEAWDRAEKALSQALNSRGLPWDEKPGEGAFYGPKVEFTLRDSIGRYWQCGTIQVDFSMPGRLGAEYVAADGSRQVPVMLHRAIFGSLERFLGILIEEHAGSFPTWLAPVQGVVMSITDAQAEYAARATEFLKNQGLRIESDLRNEKVGFKIREHTLQRIPYLFVAGDREAGSNSLAVRTRSGKDLGAIALEALAEKLVREVASRGRTILEV
ncbi:MAG TPA: threonine--tRNA ligase [Steroidobacteraceae bacterium]|nr:threonine--tRNA ligase [Steroidobacteraceae bacterium]